MKSLLKTGGSLIEVILSIAIFMILFSAIITLALGSLFALNDRQNRLTATLLAEQGLEAARSLRDRGFSHLTVGVHGLTDANGYWEWSGSSDTQGLFTRQITVTSIDSFVKEVTSAVAWSGAQSVSLTNRLSNWRQLSWVQTTQADFNLGTHTSTVAVSTGGGALELSAGSLSGDFISQSFDSTSSATLYGTLSWSATVPANTTLSFQVRTASSAAGLPGAIFVGPDGTNTTYYTVSGAPIQTDPGASGMQWLQFRCFLTRTGTGIPTPSIDSVTVGY